MVEEEEELRNVQEDAKEEEEEEEEERWLSQRDGGRHTELLELGMVRRPVPQIPMAADAATAGAEGKSGGRTRRRREQQPEEEEEEKEEEDELDGRGDEREFTLPLSRVDVAAGRFAEAKRGQDRAGRRHSLSTLSRPAHPPRAAPCLAFAFAFAFAFASALFYRLRPSPLFLSLLLLPLSPVPPPSPNSVSPIPLPIIRARRRRRRHPDSRLALLVSSLEDLKSEHELQIEALRSAHRCVCECLLARRACRSVFRPLSLRACGPCRPRGTVRGV